MIFEPEYELRDPIHGFFTVTQNELRIIDSPAFQRLRRIHQLGTTFLIYPSAEHTRFAHSIGVMTMATRVFDSLIKKHQLILNWDNDEIAKYRQMLRLACLLHDVGHGPFSHASDDLFAPEVGDHEQMGANIIQETKIGDIVDEIGRDFGFNRVHISDLLTVGLPGKEYRLLRDILTGELDADKMDYLLRDSLYCGVEYGKYDLNRILKTLALYPEGKTLKLVVEEGGVQAVESLVMARYYMFVQVYLHKTRRVYDEILIRFIKESLKGNRYPSTVDEYLKWDDNRVLEMAKESTGWGYRFLHRNHFKQVFAGPKRQPQTDSEFKELKQVFMDIEHMFGYDKVITDAYQKSPIKFESEGEPTISILKRDDSLCSFKDVAPIVSLIEKPMLIGRVYAIESEKEHIAQVVKRRLQMNWEVL